MTTWSLTPLFNELDVLEIRLAELDPVVDIHVIAESTLTFSGKQKPLNFEENIDRFKPWLDKIRYVVVDDSPTGTKVDLAHAPLMRTNDDNWVREVFQREALWRGIDGMADDDLVLLSDLDEIPSAQTVEHCRPMVNTNRVIVPKLPLHVMWMNWRWRDTIPVIARFCTGSMMKRYGPESVRQAMGDHIDVPPIAGWHLSYLGGIEAFRYKLQSAAHAELDQPPYNTPEWLEQCFATGRDPFDRDYRKSYWIPNEQLPVYVQQNLDKFSHLMGPQIQGLP